MSRTSRVLWAALLGGGLFLLGRVSAPRGSGEVPAESAPASAESVLWTCPMHPQIRLPEFGPCPICGMDLVVLEPDAVGSERRQTLSPEAVALAGVRTTRVERRDVARPVRLFGKVDFDETALRSISSWVDGRLDRLFVDYTGVRVAPGDHLVELYSPELFNAQEELLSARELLDAAPEEESTFLRESSVRAYEAAREKLLLLGLSEAQVSELEERGVAREHITINAPSGGVVIEKLVDEGDYVRTGSPIYRIADLDRLWVRLDAYEQDLAWLRYGQEVEFEVEALPGEHFAGRITFVDYVLDSRTRTAKVRVAVENPGGRLKPGMFVRAVARARLSEAGRALDPALAGKWVSPMHPEVVKDGPGTCDVCGMDLVPAEELGLAGGAEGGEPPLVVPATAVLRTGRRAVVYVEVEDAEQPTYEGRVVVLGPRAGEVYLVRAGLAEGERVVTRGAFRIDSSMQIQAKPSMMSLEDEPSAPLGAQDAWFHAALEPLLASYLELQAHLAEDELEPARAALARLLESLDIAGTEELPARARETWRATRGRLESAALAAREAPGIGELRASFEDLSSALLELVREFGPAGHETVYEAFCPMAFEGKGAAWLQRGEDVRNPYFGASMYSCGEVREAFAPSTPEPGEAEAGEHAGHAGHADHDSGGER